MAGDWIKVETVTPDKPEVIAIASILGIDQDSVTGKLIRLWIWADQQTFDGNAGGNGVSVTLSFLDRCTCANGFGQAMLQVGWLQQSLDGGLVFPNFGRHNGQTAKGRALTFKRVRKYRVAPKRSCNAKSNARRVTQSLPETETETEIDIPSTSVEGSASPAAAPSAPAGLAKLIEEWNAIAGVISARSPNRKRIAAYRARLLESTWLADVWAALPKVAASRFLTGHNDRGWRADLDWLLRPDSVTRILEGKYDDGPKQTEAF